jgi:uncharacterized damage-inducible protein DinB
MTTQEFAIQQMKSMQEFFDRSTRMLAEEHSGYKPAEGLYTAAEQVAHAAQTVEWFVKGVFAPDGFDMNFERLGAEVAAVKSLAEARKWAARAFAFAVAEMQNRPWSEWEAKLPENPILGPVPRWTIIGGLVDHTAHHRGALTVYARGLGLVPPMPYADM